MIDSEIKILLNDEELNHSNFQIENFIVGSQVGKWAQYKQCLREISSRFEKLQNIRDDAQLNRIEATNVGLWKRLIFFLWRLRKNNRLKMEIGRRRMARKSERFAKEIYHLERELACFVAIAKRLKADIGDLGNGKRELIEADSWRQKALKMAGIDLLVNGGIGQSTMELILCLPEQDRQGVLKMLAPNAKPDPFKLIDL